MTAFFARSSNASGKSWQSGEYIVPLFLKALAQHPEPQKRIYGHFKHFSISFDFLLCQKDFSSLSLSFGINFPFE